MWLVWLAIILLFLLVFFNKMREGITSSQLYEVQKIISSTKSPDEKIKELYGDTATVIISDDNIIEILNDSSLSSEDKLNKIKAIFVKLVDDRNDEPESIYFKTPDKITSTKLYNINDIINNSEISNSADKMLLIKELDVQEPTFTSIINDNSISDDVKIFGNPDGTEPDRAYTGNTLITLINQVLFRDFTQPPPPPPPPPEENSEKKKKKKKRR